MPEERKQKVRRGKILGAQYHDSGYNNENKLRDYVDTITDINYRFQLSRLQIKEAMKYIRLYEKHGKPIPENWRSFKLKYKHNSGFTLQTIVDPNSDTWKQVDGNGNVVASGRIVDDGHGGQRFIIESSPSGEMPTVNYSGNSSIAQPSIETNAELGARLNQGLKHAPAQAVREEIKTRLGLTDNQAKYVHKKWCVAASNYALLRDYGLYNGTTFDITYDCLT